MCKFACASLVQQMEAEKKKHLRFESRFPPFGRRWGMAEIWWKKDSNPGFRKETQTVKLVMIFFGIPSLSLDYVFLNY